ncbi:hypothetical protein CEP54_007648 [Fusarium duplospermum]|uniref:Heterokaryon incompatibility domain-containing protein n=1 Tax=Fusarium duplospermum TaxID=1325734 RepID=A0A428Q0B4_9HYPO|nr:hypothetical protein CEP54_007648 [Fusarium duplospermum]
MPSVATNSPTTNHGSIYYHHQLQHGKKEIRLLQIQPGQHESPVQICFLIADLDKRPHECYHALSYCWGQGPAEVAVQVEGKEMMVTETLHHALLSLRQSDEKFVCWVDAISIDQDSAQEKAHQVPLMREIYSLACHVIIWLGDATENMIVALEFLKLEEITSSKGPLQSDVALFDFLDDPPDSRDLLDTGLIALFKNPWFTRTWVLQEAALPRREPYFLCGSHIITWRCMCSVRAVVDAFLRKQHNRNNCIIHQSSIDRAALIDAFDSWNHHRIEAMRLRAQERPRGQPMSLLLFLSGYAQATKRSDRVYGLLGLVSEAFLDGLPIDYDETPQDTFRRAMRSMLAEEGPRCLMIKEQELLECRCQSECSCRFDPSSASGASWIPDLTKNLRDCPHRPLYMGPFDVCPGVAPTVRINGYSLFVRGLLLDSVAHTRSTSLPRDFRHPSESHEATWMSLLPLVQFLSAHARVVSHHEPHFRGEGWCSECCPQKSRLEHLEDVANRLKELAIESSRLLGTPNGADEESQPALSPTTAALDEILEAEESDQDMEILDDEDPENEFSGFEATRSLLFSHSEDLVDEFDKCGLYRSPTQPPTDFWEAACRTLLTDGGLPCASPWQQSDNDKILLALHWESLDLKLEELHGKNREDSASTTGRRQRVSKTCQTSISRALGALIDDLGLYSVFEGLKHDTKHALTLRNVFVTEKGWMGLGPRFVQPGDIVAVLFGADIPYILRPVEDHYILVGECYVHGIMDGELMDELPDTLLQRPSGAGFTTKHGGHITLQDFEIR